MTEKEILLDMFQNLIPWYDKNKRDLPWRKDTEPYHVWVSEIMLQQTRVEAVREYYRRFLNKLPTIFALSVEPEESLLKLWEGLGYYNRVKNLQKAARTICENYDGVFPDKYEDIRKLSGIGDYTAGAIASICFHQATPAVDGNVLRVYSRVLGDFSNIDKSATKKQVTENLRQVYPKDQPGAATQSLMELGAMVCVPNGEPHCKECPVSHVCVANRENLWQKLPVRNEKRKRKVVEKTVFILYHEGRVALHKRRASGLLAGMWEFPNVDTVMSEQEAVSQVAMWKLKPTDLLMKTCYTHIFSHVEWHMTAYYIRCNENNETWKWVTTEELDSSYALPSAFLPFRRNMSESNQASF